MSDGPAKFFFLFIIATVFPPADGGVEQDGEGEWAALRY